MLHHLNLLSVFRTKDSDQEVVLKLLVHYCFVDEADSDAMGGGGG